MAKYLVEIREDMHDSYSCGVTIPNEYDLSMFIGVGAGETYGFIPRDAMNVKCLKDDPISLIEAKRDVLAEEVASLRKQLEPHGICKEDDESIDSDSVMRLFELDRLDDRIKTYNECLEILKNKIFEGILK